MDTKTLSVGDYVRCGGQCHRVTGTTDRGTFYSAKVPPPRKLKTPIFGRDPVPFGRRADVLEFERPQERGEGDGGLELGEALPDAHPRPGEEGQVRVGRELRAVEEPLGPGPPGPTLP